MIRGSEANVMSHGLGRSVVRPLRRGGRRSAPLTAVLAVALLLGPARTALSQTGERDAEPPAKKEAARTHVIILPIVYYTPETQLAFGAGGVINFRLGRISNETRPSSLWLLAVYTQKKQFQVQLTPEIYLRKNSFVLNMALRYERFPQKFYGVGNDVPASEEESYTPKTAGFRVALKKRFLGHFYAGLQYELENTVILATAPGGLLESGDIAGSRGGWISGLGVNISWDSRDNVFFPRRGRFFSLAADVYARVLGSDFNYTSIIVDLRTYVPVAAAQVLAFQAYFKTRGGNPPFYQLALLGGDSIMRGYYRGRYRDKTLVAVQAEYRVPVWWRFGAAAFAGLGEVGAGLEDFRLGNLRYSLGFGVRFKLDTREGTNVRVDFAWGEHSHGLYMTVQEAF
jgi:hypothetical protein